MKNSMLLLFSLLIFNSGFSQTITGNYLLQRLGGIGDDGKLSENSKAIEIYSYTYSNSKSSLELLNPKGTKTDTITSLNTEYNFEYKTVQTSISFTKSKFVKDLNKKMFEKLWIIDGKETYDFKSLPALNWVIKDETKSIEGFTCKKAEVVYTADGYTFTYTAWFNENIPINDGPFEFWGLPGFIFELGIKEMFICKFVNL